MSRQTHLPPRCPFQKKFITPNPCKDNELRPRHHKSISQSSILEEQPAWLDDLLNESDSSTRGSFHRRSASDSVTFLDTLAPLPSFAPVDDDETPDSNGNDSGFEFACTYGPNSPRRKGKLNFSEDAIVSALSEFVSQNPMHYSVGDLCISRTPQFDSVRDACGSTGEENADTKPVKRHSGQRSRVRKLQYIAELERTVDIFQTLESELAVKVASLHQQRVALSTENEKLKKQVARLQQEKMIVDGQHQSLRREVERLKMSLTYSSDNKVGSIFRSSSAAEAVNLEATWKMLDFRKLDLK